MIKNIEDILKQLRVQIELNLRNNENNLSLIDQKFRELFELIEELSLNNPDYFEYYSYQYHINYSSFCSSIGRENEARKHQNKSKSYERDFLNIEKNSASINSHSNEAGYNSNSEWVFLENTSEHSDFSNLLAIIENYQFLDSEIFGKIKDQLEIIKNIKINNFVEYVEVENISFLLNTLITEIISKVGEKDNNQSIIIDFDEFLRRASEMMYQLKIDFMKRVVFSTEPDKLLFNQNVFTEETINRNYRLLAKCFHPDRWNQDENQALANKVFVIVLACKESLEKKIKDESVGVDSIDHHEQKGDELWQQSLDFNYAKKQEWDKIRHYNSEVLKNWTIEQLEAERIKILEKSQQHYRSACKIADKRKLSNKQIYFRGSMALCLRSAGKNLEAKLYALGSILLIEQDFLVIDPQIFERAKNILNKVQGKDIGVTNDTPKSQEQKSKNSENDVINNILSIVKSNQQSSTLANTNNFSHQRQRQTQKEFRNYLGKLVVTVSVDKSLVSYKTPEEEILRTKQNAKMHKVAGLGLGIGGLIGGGGLAVAAGGEILQAAGIVAGLALGGPVVAIIGGLSAIGLGLFGARALFKKGNRLLKEPSIREKLNEIIAEAVQHHDNKEYENFLKKLSTNYFERENLLKLEESKDLDSIDNLSQEILSPNKVIDSLLKHGFRPDGIGYLLNLIGDALTSEKINISGLNSTDLNAKAIEFYKAVSSQRLYDVSNKLDERITELRKNTLQSKFKNFEDAIRLKDYSRIAKEYIKDSQEMPFKSRLEEVRNIAKINLAIIRITNGSEDDYNSAKLTIEEVRKSINESYQFISKSSLRLEVLEDYYWIVTGENLESNKIEILTPIELFPEENNEKGRYLMYLEDLLSKSKSRVEMIDIQNKIAHYYETKAEENKTNKLISLKFWLNAKNAFHESLKLNKEGSIQALGYARCLLQLFEYSNVILFFQNNRNLLNSSESWFYCSVANRKCNKYQDAEEYIIESLQKDPKNNEAEKERNLIKKLKQEFPKSKKLELNINEDHFLNVQKIEENKCYKILSIDGGGVRGIIPAMWLDEIERRTLKPVSHLFNTISGTSCGGIIAACLAAPNHKKTVKSIDSDGDANYEDLISTYEPKFSANEIVQLFKTKSRKIFSSDKNSFFSFFNLDKKTLFRPKYTDTGRKTLFNEYFGSLQIKDSLTNLIIPAYNESMGNQTHLFNRKDNQTFVDVLMATTAAPTFFPSYEIKEIGVFVDGGVNLNNPSMSAYTDSIKNFNINPKNTFVLSLGTGSCIPDPLNPDLYRGRLFWANNIHKIALNAQEGNTDIQMFNTLGDRYQRWQVWMEKPIGLDAFDDISLNNLYEMGRQYIEELDASEDNLFNKLIEKLKEN
jgi:patatin-like phospholipase/acyl hydrolase